MTSNNKWISSAVVAVALLVAAASAECDCGSSHPYVGFSAHLINRVGSDSPAGVVTILDDCHVAISDFYFNAEPPLTRVWGATNVSDINGTGFELHPTVLDTPLDGAYLVFRLPVDVDFDDFSVLSIWCVSVAVDLASVALGPGCASTHARVGAMYSLAGVHGIHGVVSVLDDCRIQISEFRYDGEAPDAWVWSGELGGWPISTGPMRAKDGVDMILPLPAGYDLDDLNTVSIWCRAMNATLALTEVIENKCAATHPLVGAIGSLTPLAHEVSGLVEVVDDCTAVVHDLTYDGLAPFTYLWLGPTVATMASGGRGFNASLTSEVDGDTFVLHLPAGTSWDDWQAASVWCEGGAGMDLGSTTVRKCDSTSDRVGFTASFPLSAAHDIRGVFTITDDCHAHITGWTFDGAPPDTYIFAASAGALADGDNISGPVKLGAADDDQLLLTLPVGAAWDDYDTISAWCVEVSSDLGSFGLENFCGASHAKVGGSASIRASPIIHDIRGVVTVIDDCTFRVDGLGFDATAPETFWWGSTSADLTAGGRVADDQLILAIEDETVVVRLSTGTDWDDIDYLSVYCESASMDMGSGMLPEPAACSANHPFVGFRGELTLGGNPGEHGVRGKVEVVDDCTILVTEYYYDGAAPRVLFWGADSAANVNGGIELSAPQDDVQSSETFVVRLPTGTTLDDVAYFTSWCSLMNVTMAAVQLGPGVCEDYRPAEASDPRDAFDNCITLLDGKYNVYWTLSGAGSVVYAVEAAVRDDEWIGFGWSENPAVTQMPGADVVIAGFDDGLPYAIDHKLYARSQCDYSGANTGGVCPDAGAGFSDDATLLYAEVVDGVTFIVFEKALNTSDTDADVAVDPTVEHAAVWAIGPRNADTDGVVILRHLSENRATFGAGNGIRLADTGNTCTAPVVPLPPPTVDVSTPRSTVDGASVTTLNFTIGSNPRYPNPPGWGLAFWINGEETPDLTLVRGVEYTFNVAGGPTHPLYITDDIIGGRSDGGETVYAGQSGAWEGTPSAPYTATWTPPADTPDLLYYQCWEHQRLGWEITFVNCGNGVVDEGEECDGGDGCEHDCTATPVDDDDSDDAGGINAGAAASASDDGPSIPILIGVLVPLGVIVLAMVLCAVFMLCIHKGDKGAGQGKAASGKGAKLAPVVGKSTAAKASSAGTSSAQAATSGKGKKAAKVSAASGSASDTSGSASASGSYYSS